MSGEFIFGLLALAAAFYWLYQGGDIDLGGDSSSASDSISTTPADDGGGDLTSAITAWAAGVQQAEGWIAPSDTSPDGSVSYRNNNPGNIEGSGDAGSSGGFAVFSSVDAGTAALQNLLAKYASNNPGWTLQQATNYYVNGNPASTAQNTVPYAQTVASVITSALGFIVTPTTTLKDIIGAAG